MAQLHLYLPKALEEELRRRAKARRITVSKYLAEIVKRDLGTDWPKGFFEEVAGGWQGPPLERAPQGEPEERDPL